MKKRILVLLSTVALMVVMLAMSVAPAFADRSQYSCTLLGMEWIAGKKDLLTTKEIEEQGGECVKLPKS